MFADQFGHVSCVEALIKAGAEVNKVNDTGVTALILAAHSWHTSCTELLIEAGADLEKMSDYGFTALKAARKSGQVDCAKALIQAGPNGGKEVKAEAHTEQGSCLKFYIDVGAEIDIGEACGNSCTPLMTAAHHGNVSCVEMLIKAGAQVKKVNKNGCTALKIAAAYGHTPCVEVLVNTGSEVNKADGQGFTTLIYICQSLSSWSF